MSELIQNCSLDNVERYGEIYAAAFSKAPWNDPWKAADCFRSFMKNMISKRKQRLF